MKSIVGDYKVEYASSGRSTCKITQNPIPKDALRIGEMKQAQNFDGTYPEWYSFKSFIKNKKMVEKFQKNARTHQIIGLSSLRPEDQKQIKDLMGVEEKQKKRRRRNE